ncbi:hypothetical protein ANN_22147 [Periplaneta americana]|uniref:Uncharacterized protein n=1 Tax=Periplaneta americana TaxID=6978 RepID=A0ABQ8S7C9_PERAM|nr:hypothetical protein ANN_22147 [Periplaneta americana]
MLNANPDNLHRLIMSDEAHFDLSDYVNKQNFRYWSDEHPFQVWEKPLHSPKVTVWCGIIDPYFFEDGHTVTVNSERHQQKCSQY